MDVSVLKKTQESLGKVIKKPPLTEKLLNKPPFRFLHDIFTEVIRTTGFMKGLYSDAEMKSENVKEKDSKLLFLQKAVDVVVMVSGRPLSVKPPRIVAGNEPDKTNELLQAIAYCCLNKLSSEDAVRRVLSGERPDPKMKPTSTRSQPQEEPGSTEEKTKRLKAEESKERQKNRDSSEHFREHRDKGRDKSRSSEKDKDPRERHRDREPRRRDQDKTRTQPKEEDPRTQVKTEERPQNISPEEPPKAVNTETSTRIPRPSSAKGQRRRAKVGSQDESDSEGDADAAQKNVPEASTEPAAANEPAPSRRMVRPSSARPAPPRVKRQESNAESPAESAKPSAVILDGRKTEEEENDEDQQFLVQEALPSAATDSTDYNPVSAEAEEDQTHGGLVKKILETKKYYEVAPSSPNAQSVVSAEAQRKERDLVRREIERLQSSVQTVCKSALPLGKIMDYIQEDMDAMKNELQQWRQENKEHAQALTTEYRATELAVQPLKSELSELEDLIQEQQAQICAVRATILRNQEKIQRMVTGIQS